MGRGILGGSGGGTRVIELDERTAAKPPTIRDCCRRWRRPWRCCSMKTPSCGPGQARRCSAPSRRIHGPPRRARSCLLPTAARSPAPWRLPGLGTVLASALFLHRLLVVQSKGDSTRPVGWVQSSAMLVRCEAAAAVGYLDPDFFVYSDETDFCKRLRDAGGEILFVPSAEAVHHEQLSSDRRAGSTRVVEFHRGRDRYLRKHRGPVVAWLARPLGALPYLLRALAATVLPGHDPRWYLLHARQALLPGSGDGLKEAADAYNRESSSRRSAS